jgi:hypothetical protein
VIAFLDSRRAVGNVLVAKNQIRSRARGLLQLMTGPKRIFFVVRGFSAILFGAILFFVATPTGNIELERSLAKLDRDKFAVERSCAYDRSTPRPAPLLRFVESVMFHTEVATNYSSRNRMFCSH